MITFLRHILAPCRMGLGVIQNSLEEYLQLAVESSCSVTYEGWISFAHPENVQKVESETHTTKTDLAVIDHMFYLPACS